MVLLSPWSFSDVSCMLWWKGNRSFPHAPKAMHKSPFPLPLSPAEEAQEGAGWAGGWTGLPLGAVVGQNKCLAQTNTLFISKKKKKKERKRKSIPWPPLLFALLSVETESVRFPGRAALATTLRYKDGEFPVSAMARTTSVSTSSLLLPSRPTNKSGLHGLEPGAVGIREPWGLLWTAEVRMGDHCHWGTLPSTSFYGTFVSFFLKSGCHLSPNPHSR